MVNIGEDSGATKDFKYSSLLPMREKLAPKCTKKQEMLQVYAKDPMLLLNAVL